MTAEPVLQVRNLDVNFATPQGAVAAVSGVSFDVRAGECLAVVGESGSGKTQVLMACLGLLASNGTARGSALFAGKELIGANERELNRVRGTGIGLLSQDPLSSLTPHLRIETLLTEGLVDRGLATRIKARQRALQALAEVDIPEPEARLRQYPHELSGGMLQRVALAAALMCGPQLLFADEPTTALDVSVQARVLELLAKVRDRGAGVLIITHDLGVVAGLADRVAVMYAGRIVETATTDGLFAAPEHPYTAALLAAVPRLHGDAQARLVGIPGDPPQPSARPPGCAFAPRCERAVDTCSESRPELTQCASRNQLGAVQGESGAATTARNAPITAVACHRPLQAAAEIA
ncbi:MAG: ABC transporter ATP-binding protein [Steroidobacteraceae bacterium]|nr:ABC transporter ATP-binding protein [Steroidobacteraceae bacterium]